jgi:hypothetical protein
MFFPSFYSIACAFSSPPLLFPSLLCPGPRSPFSRYLHVVRGEGTELERIRVTVILRWIKDCLAR